jgi:hypothetical protein
MAIMAAQASACFDPLYWATCVAWQVSQTSGPGRRALAASVAVPWAVPWQESQPTETPAWRDSFQSETIPGVLRAWHSMQRMLALGAEANGLARSRTAATVRGRAASRVSPTG